MKERKWHNAAPYWFMMGRIPPTSSLFFFSFLSCIANVPNSSDSQMYDIILWHNVQQLDLPTQDPTNILYCWSYI